MRLRKGKDEDVGRDGDAGRDENVGGKVRI